MIDKLINLDLYPIDDLDSVDGRALLERCQNEITDDGALVLPKFVRTTVVKTLLQEANRYKALGHRMEGEFTPYSDNLSEPDNTDLPADHPRRMRLPAAHRFIAGDHFPASSPIRQLYKHPLIVGFIGSVLDIPSLHTIEDPLGCINLLVYEPGDCNGWHFDTTEFIVSVVLQPASSGGEYQYIPALRSSCNENLEAVAFRMRNPDSVESLHNIELDAGSLFLFKGEHTLHRVTEVKGNKDRIVAILSYHRTPGHMLSDGSKLAMYGRVV